MINFKLALGFHENSTISKSLSLFFLRSTMVKITLIDLAFKTGHQVCVLGSSSIVSPRYSIEPHWHSLNVNLSSFVYTQSRFIMIINCYVAVGIKSKTPVERRKREKTPSECLIIRHALDWGFSGKNSVGSLSVEYEAMKATICVSWWRRVIDTRKGRLKNTTVVSSK